VLRRQVTAFTAQLHLWPVASGAALCAEAFT